MNRYLSTLLLTAALTLPALAGVQERETADIKTGTTSITFGGTLATALDTADVVFQKAQPARINPGKGSVTYVASGGAIDLINAKTEIVHSGGITLAKEIVPPAIAPSAPKAPKQYKTATILDPIIVLSEVGAVTPVAKISAIVVVNGVSLGRLDVFTIDGTVFETAPLGVPKNKKITASDLSLKLTAEAADALDAALGLDLFDNTTVVGTAEIDVKLASSNL